MEQIETQAKDLQHLTETSLDTASGFSSGRLGPSAVDMQSPRNLDRQPTRPVGSAPTGDNSAFPTASPSFSPEAGGGVGSPAKRKGDTDDANPKQQRSKRKRYISIACNECKRRKIKCNGETPCRRCGSLSLDCLYSANCCSNNFRDSEEYKQMSDKLCRLEEHVSVLSQNVHTLRQETWRLAPLQDRILPMPSAAVSPAPSVSVPPSLSGKTDLAPIHPVPIFRGPTSSAFTVGVAKNTLHNMGYSGEANEELAGPLMGDTACSSPVAKPSPADPLWDFDREEIVRLCRIHEDEIGVMYPVVKIEDVMNHAHHLLSWMDGGRRRGYAQPPDYPEKMASVPTLVVKSILCNALAVEEHGHSERAIRLYDSMQTIIDRKLIGDRSDIANLPLLALIAGYRFLSNDEVLAWRIMGQVTRLCLEQGLHRRDGLAKITDEQERRHAVITFWTAYVLDRQWSFGTGLPYVMQDDMIDPGLPLPENQRYLVSMITYSRLGAKIWRLVDVFEPAIVRNLAHDEFEALDKEIMAWYDSIPDETKLVGLDPNIPLPDAATFDLQRLKIWTRLRLNQMRIWLHTPVLHSASSINTNMDLAQKVVDLAKETIQYLSSLDNSSNVYRRLQVFYHQFLTSAIAVLFLASTHQPVQFSSQCREEFYLATNLICDMSAKSFVSRRLWAFVRCLKAYAPRVGLVCTDDGDPSSEPQLHSALPASLSGHTQHPAAASPAYGPSAAQAVTQPSSSWPLPAPVALTSHGRPHLPMLGSTASSSPAPGRQPDPYYGNGGNNGQQLQSEMVRIFEGYVSMNGFPDQLVGAIPGVTDNGDVLQGERRSAVETLYGQAKMF